MNCFDLFRAARCGQRPMAVDMGPMASTYNFTLICPFAHAYVDSSSPNYLAY